MACEIWTPEDDKLLVNLKSLGMADSDIARKMRRTRQSVKQRRRRLEGKIPASTIDVCSDTGTTEKWEETVQDNSWVITARSRTIRDLDSAIKAAKVDLSVWEVERHVINKWDNAAKVRRKGTESIVTVELWQVKIYLRRRVAKTIADATAGLIERMQRHSPKYPKFPKPKKITDPHLLFIGLHDHHFGKLAWAAETGENYDLKIAERLYQYAGEELVRKSAGFPIERIVLPLGHDFLHIDNLANSTTAGTPQDVDGRFAKIFETGVSAVIKLVDYLINVAPVSVLWVPGNHDYQSSYMLSKTIAAWYRHANRVTVDASPCPRKRVHYGNNLIGCTHGKEEKPQSLPGIMAGTWPDEWAKSHCREWLVGDKHTPRETHFHGVTTHDGVVVRVLPSLAGTDSWHHRHGYIGGPRVAHGLLYSREHGFAAQVNAYAREAG